VPQPEFVLAQSATIQNSWNVFCLFAAVGIPAAFFIALNDFLGDRKK